MRNAVNMLYVTVTVVDSQDGCMDDGRGEEEYQESE